MSHTQSPQQRKLFLLADELGLGRAERLELASYMLRRTITSWRQLDDVQVARMLDALEGYQLIRDLMSMRVG